MIANEAFLFVMALLFFIAVDKSTWVAGYEWFVISIFLIYTTIISFVAVLEFVKDVVQMFKEKFWVEEEEEAEEIDSNKDHEESVVNL